MIIKEKAIDMNELWLLEDKTKPTYFSLKY